MFFTSQELESFFGDADNFDHFNRVINSGGGRFNQFFNLENPEKDQEALLGGGEDIADFGEEFIWGELLPDSYSQKFEDS